VTDRPLTRIRIAGVPEHFNLPWLLALERRAFVRAGIDLKWRTVPEGTGAMCDQLHEGEVDVALLVTEGAVRHILDGGAARIVGPFVDSPLTWGVHVGAGSGIDRPEQLKGARFAISRIGSGSHLAALAYAQARGWTLERQDLVVVNDLNGALALLAGPGPAALLWEKYTMKPHVHRGAVRCVDEHVSSWPAFMVVASEAILTEQPLVIQRMMRVIHDQAAGLMAKKTAPEIIAHRYGLALEDARAWFQDTRWNTGNATDEDALRRVVDTLLRSGRTTAVPPGTLIDTLVWKAAKR
jgi:ABC-type nitrate/sulfonate/bicarbonate transport system substrate-binding protein